MTTKGKKFKLDVHFAESRRIVKRLTNQKVLITELLKSGNVEIMNRELAKLDHIHQSLLETYAQVREIIQVQDDEDESEEPERLAELVKVVDKEDSEVFQTKKSASEWLITQVQDEEKSTVSKRSGRSRKAGSHRSKRSRSGDSRRTGSADSRGSVRSAKSNCSRTSNVSRTSKKAKIAGLRAEVEVLKSEGKLEIDEQVKFMKLETEKFAKEQHATLLAEIARKEDAILQGSQEMPDVRTLKEELKEERLNVSETEEERLELAKQVFKVLPV